MLCQDIMKKDVQCISEGDTAEAAARKMRDANIGFLPVCDGSNKVQGTLTDRDLAIRVVADALPCSTPVSQILTRQVVACRPDDDIEDAQEMMSENHKSRILVLDESDRLVGVISLSDIAQVEAGGHVSETVRRVSEREAHL